MKSKDQRSVAIVTGAARGIGAAISERLLAEGWRVVLADQAKITPPRIGETLSVKVDVTRESDIQRLVKRTLGDFGRIDALVNNAAIAHPGEGPVEKLALARWNKYLATNLTSVFLGAKHAAPALRKSKGAIVNVASTRALMSEPDTEAYTACKGGIVALTHALANSLGPDVRVNCISPGWIHTRPEEKLKAKDHAQHPVGRVGTPADIAGMVAYLLGRDAGFLTGANFVVDGGMTRKMVYE